MYSDLTAPWELTCLDRAEFICNCHLKSSQGPNELWTSLLCIIIKECATQSESSWRSPLIGPCTSLAITLVSGIHSNNYLLVLYYIVIRTVLLFFCFDMWISLCTFKTVQNLIVHTIAITLGNLNCSSNWLITSLNL